MSSAATSLARTEYREPEAAHEKDRSERRLRLRFPLELPVRYRTLAQPRRVTGMGRVVNMSSSGVLVASQHEVTVGVEIELSIEWPFLLDGRIPLQLVASGKVVRCDATTFALLLTRHQYRTKMTIARNVENR